MAARTDLLQRTRGALAKAGFAVSEQADVHPISFDVVARRDNQLLLIKVLGNVDALNEPVARELRALAQALSAKPILVGERSGGGDLEDGVAYSHRGVPVMTLLTLEEMILEDVPPVAYASPGGVHVQLRGELLRQLREQRALTLGHLAEIAGVSRRAIQMYEEGMRATVDAAIRLEEFLHESLVVPADPFTLFTPPQKREDSPRLRRALSALEEDVFKMLRGKGFEVMPTRQSPFQAVTREQSTTILTGLDKPKDARAARRAQLLSSITAVAEKDGMIVVRRETTVTQLRGTPLVQQDELERMRDPDELRDLLSERRKRQKAQSP